MEDDLRITHASQKSAECELEVRKNTEKELATYVVHLQVDLDKANEKIAQLTQVKMICLGSDRHRE